MHCAPCHGPDGKGNGPVARELKTPPKDLTRIAEENQGTFPPNFVEEVIDGLRHFDGARGSRDADLGRGIRAGGKGTSPHAREPTRCRCICDRSSKRRPAGSERGARS